MSGEEGGVASGRVCLAGCLALPRRKNEKQVGYLPGIEALPLAWSFMERWEVPQRVPPVPPAGDEDGTDGTERGTAKSPRLLVGTLRQ